MGVGWGLRVEVEVLDDERTSTPAIFKGPRAVSHPTCCCASLDRCDLLVGLEGFHLMSMVRTPDALVLDGACSIVCVSVILFERIDA